MTTPPVREAFAKLRGRIHDIRLPGNSFETSQRWDAMFAALNAVEAALSATPTNTFVQQVPDHCDRIVWRNAYYSLPISAPPPQVPEPAAWRYRYHAGAKWRLAENQNQDFTGLGPGFEQQPLYASPPPNTPKEPT